MTKEEKEEWLYEEYQYTSNFDFDRLDKYEEANNDLCIDDLILDYTMLYEHYKKERERLNNIINELEIYINKTIIDGGTRGSMTFWYRQIYDYLQELKESDKE